MEFDVEENGNCRELMNHLFALVSALLEEAQGAAIAGQSSACSLAELGDLAGLVQAKAENVVTIAQAVRIVAGGRAVLP